MSRAEFGSVRFFRRMITLVVLVMIIALAAGVAVLSHNYSKTKTELERLTAAIEASSQDNGSGEQEPAEMFAYQQLYNDLYVERPENYTKVYDAERFFYLTFDGGPSDRTVEILDVLREQGIKATFFVVGGDDSSSKAIMKRIVDEGHAIGIYGYQAQASDVYMSVDAYLEDFNKEFNIVYEATGVKPSVFRFQNGTINKYNALIRSQLTSEMIRRGFTYYDWNSTAGDNLSGATTDSIYNTAIATAAEKQRIFMLLHDTKGNNATVLSLPAIIKYYADKGYTFDKITNSVQPIAFD